MLPMIVEIVLSLARRVRIKLLLVVLACGFSFGVMRFLTGLGYEVGGTLAVPTVFSLQVLLALTVFIVYCTTEFTPTVGFPSRMYVLPAKTSLLVLAQMLAGALAGVLTYLTVAATAWIVLGAKWPLLGPSCFMAVFLAWNMAFMWFAPGLSLVKAPPAMLIWALLLVWVGKRYGIDSLPMNPTRMWTHVTGVELLTMTLLGAGAYALAVVGVSKDRCGDSPELSRLRAWLEGEVGGRGHRDKDFAGPVAAQMWFEARTKGYLIPAANAVVQLLLVGLYLYIRRDGTETVAPFVGAVVIPIGCPYFVGMLAGSCSRPAEPRQMDSFRAIRPMTTAALARVMLKNGGLSLLLTWLGWLAGSALLIVCVCITGQAAGFFGELAETYAKIGPGRLSLVVAAVAVFSWTAMAWGAASAMSDRRWVQWIPRIAVVAISLVLIYLHARRMIAPTQYVTIVKAICLTGGSWCVGTTLLAFYRARRKRLIGSPTMGLAAIGWVILRLIAGYALSQLYHGVPADAPAPLASIPTSSVLFLLAGLLMTPFTPLAKAPLNLARSRSH